MRRTDVEANGPPIEGEDRACAFLRRLAPPPYGLAIADLRLEFLVQDMVTAIFRLTQNGKSAPPRAGKSNKGKGRKVVAARLGAIIGAAHADQWRAEMPDDRRSPRAQTNHVASALIGTGETATCRVVNKGVAGLRLQLLEDKECPEEFGLTIPALRFVGIVRREWRRGADIGVSILQS